VAHSGAYPDPAGLWGDYQRRDHRRLGRQLRRVQPAIAVAEALASVGDADEVPQTELLAHGREQFELEVQQGDQGSKPWRTVA
jgi:hypothetical protein